MTAQQTPKSEKIQGEGDYEAAERYDASARAFAQSGKVKAAADKAKTANAAEEADMQQAERAGLSHNKGEDPALPHAPKGQG